MQTLTRLFTPREAADAARLSERTIRAALAAGRLRSVRPGGLRRVRITETELERFIQNRAPRAR